MTFSVIEVRPHRGGYQCFEAPGVCPFFIEDPLRSALTYATNRMRGRTGEIRVMNADGTVARVIPFVK